MSAAGGAGADDGWKRWWQVQEQGKWLRKEADAHRAAIASLSADGPEARACYRRWHREGRLGPITEGALAATLRRAAYSRPHWRDTARVVIFETGECAGWDVQALRGFVDAAASGDEVGDEALRRVRSAWPRLDDPELAEQADVWLKEVMLPFRSAVVCEAAARVARSARWQGHWRGHGAPAVAALAAASPGSRFVAALLVSACDGTGWGTVHDAPAVALLSRIRPGSRFLDALTTAASNSEHGEPDPSASSQHSDSDESESSDFWGGQEEAVVIGGGEPSSPSAGGGDSPRAGSPQCEDNEGTGDGADTDAATDATTGNTVADTDAGAEDTDAGAAGADAGADSGGGERWAGAAPARGTAGGGLRPARRSALPPGAYRVDTAAARHRVRAEPDLSSEVLREVPRGSVLQVVAHAPVEAAGGCVWACVAGGGWTLAARGDARFLIPAPPWAAAGGAPARHGSAGGGGGGPRCRELRGLPPAQSDRAVGRRATQP